MTKLSLDITPALPPELQLLRDSIELNNRKIEAHLQLIELPTGALLGLETATSPPGYFLCDGSTFNGDENPNLEAYLGSTTLPDYRGRVLVGMHSGQTEFDTLGEMGGARTHTLTIPELPEHNHGFGAAFDKVGDAGGFTPSVVNINFAAGATGFYARGATPILQLDPTGDGVAHNNIQPYRVVNWFIKA